MCVKSPGWTIVANSSCSRLIDESEDVENVALTLIKQIKCLSLLKSVFLPFVEQVRFGTSQIYNFRAAITLKWSNILILHYKNVHIHLHPFPELCTPCNSRHQKLRVLRKLHICPGTSRSYIHHKSGQEYMDARMNHK